jgi:glycosyltransferase involved in cell wall biosynthesis
MLCTRLENDCRKVQNLKIGIIANTSWYIYNFRASLISALIENGHTIFVFAPKDNYSKSLIQLGVKYYNWDLDRLNTNPIYEVISLFRLYRLLRKNNIEMNLSYTPKGNIHSSIISMYSNIDIINNISGMGTTRNGRSILSKTIVTLYKLLLQKSVIVFFQNVEDRNYLLGEQLSLKVNSDILPGSGVDLRHFDIQYHISPNRFDFLLSARLLIEKGVYDFIEACKIIRSRNFEIKCALVGPIESNKHGINASQIDEWENDGIVEYLGFTDDIREILKDIKCFVLPSYYGEGVPRGLLEAASMGIPLITTEHPGCRDTVIDEISGFLCEIRNPKDLAEKMIRILEMTDSEILLMGGQGRKKMIAEYDEKIVIGKYLNIINRYRTSLN